MINLINSNIGHSMSFSILGAHSSAGDYMEWQIIESNLDGYVSLVRFDRRDEKSSLKISFFKIDHITHFSIGNQL
tara:strand:- start:898 stop:1122 length:225 start_codon:yes stop_codon:yes gene_type:complete